MHDTDEHTQQRLEALEIKAAYSEDAQDRLSDQLYRQQRQIERLEALVVELQRQLQAQGSAGSLRSQLDERPPHY